MTNVCKYQLTDVYKYQLTDVCKYQLTYVCKYQLSDVRKYQLTNVCKYQLTDVCKYQLTNVYKYQLTNVCTYQLTDVCKYQLTDVCNYQLTNAKRTVSIRIKAFRINHEQNNWKIYISKSTTKDINPEKMREKNTNENDPVSTLVHVCLSTISYAPCKCEGTKQVVINSSMDK